MNKMDQITNGLRNSIRAAIDKPKQGQGSRILMNMAEFLKVSGRNWGDKNISQDSVIGEFLARLRNFLQTTQVRYESDQKLYILIDKQWYLLQRTDWTVNLLPLLHKIGAPSAYVNAEIISKLFPKIVEIWKSLDTEYKPISKLLE